MAERDPLAYLDLDYIRETSRHIADALREGVPLEVNFQPGDMTTYQLVFVPLHDLRCAPGRRAQTPGQVDWDARCSFGAGRGFGAAMIAYDGHGATALDLAAGHYVAGYLEGLFPRAGNCEALAALFDAIAEEMS